ncbi:MAG: putative MgtC family protein [Acidimicrobiales bacterium]|nr:putative MgtC family protein [Acidimicrobiales bacterium]
MQSDLVLFGHIALATALGFVLGWEREIRGHPLGGRTFATVATGAAAITAIGVNDFPTSAERAIAGIITGVGFIGAGMVVNTGGGVRGLTTAAAVWTGAAIGIVVGARHLMLGVALTGMVLVVLELRHLPVLRHLDASAVVGRFQNDTEFEGNGSQGAPPPAPNDPPAR